jgi:O-antigen/teichoic acid export membrane protein
MLFVSYPKATIATKARVATVVQNAVSSDRLYSWSDQAVVSIANFLALILIARWSGASQVGIYAVGYSILAMLLAVQESLITRPYSIQLLQPERSAAEHASASLMLAALLAVASTLVFGICALVLGNVGFNESFAAVGWALALAAPCVLIREFARRFSFAHLRVTHALLLDIVVAILNVATLVGLAMVNGLTAASAFASLGLSCGIGALGWLYCARREFKASRGHLSAVFKRSGSLGKWVLLGHLAAQVQAYTTHWLMLPLVGAAATGVYAACLSIVAFANPLLFGFLNVLTPKCVRILRAEGLRGLKQHVIWDTLVLAALMSLFCLVVVLTGERVMHLLYPGPEYQGHLHTLNVLVLVTLVSAIGVPAYTALISAERAGAAAKIATGCALLNVAVVWWSLMHWGLLGAMYGMLFVETVGSIARWLAFLAMSDREESGSRKG